MVCDHESHSKHTSWRGVQSSGWYLADLHHGTMDRATIGQVSQWTVLRLVLKCNKNVRSYL